MKDKEARSRESHLAVGISSKRSLIRLANKKTLNCTKKDCMIHLHEISKIVTFTEAERIVVAKG